MLWVFLIPFFIAEIFVAVNCFLWKPPKKGEAVPKKQPPIMFPLIPAGAQILFFLIMTLIQKFAMAGSNELLPRSAMIVICLLTDGAVFCEYWKLHDRARRLTKQLAILCVGMFFLEFAVFNAKSFDLHYQEMQIPIQSMSEYFTKNQLEENPEPEHHMFVDGDHIRVETNETKVRIDDIPSWTKAVAFNMEQDEEQRPFLVRISITDDNFSDAPQISGAKLISTYEGDVAFSIAPYGELNYVVAEFNFLTTPVRVFYMNAMSSIPYAFSAIRYFVLLAICGLILIIKEFGVQYMEYNGRSIWQNICLAVVTVACVATAFAYRNPQRGKCQLSRWI